MAVHKRILSFQVASGNGIKTQQLAFKNLTDSFRDTMSSDIYTATGDR